MYGLEIHKGITVNDPIPLSFRPILSAIGTCNYNLARFFVPIIKQFIINECTVKDSFLFCKEIIAQDLNLFMTSFDIQSLFVNIPLDETISICVDLVFHKKEKVKGMFKQHFKQLLTFSVKSSCFLFIVYYKQVDGVVMGSPLRPTLANLFLVYYEHEWLENCPLQFQQKYYHRYRRITFSLCFQDLKILLEVVKRAMIKLQ